MMRQNATIAMFEGKIAELNESLGKGRPEVKGWVSGWETEGQNIWKGEYPDNVDFHDWKEQIRFESCPYV